MPRRATKTISAAALLTVLFLGVFAPVKIAFAADTQTCNPNSRVKGQECYVALTTIPGATIGCKPTYRDGVPIYDPQSCEKTNPLKVIKNIYGVSITVAAVLAVGMIIFAGIEYVTTEAISGKSNAKEKWQGALYGLLLLLASYLILRTINVDLVNVNLDLGKSLVGDSVDANKAKKFASDIAMAAQQAKAAEDSVSGRKQNAIDSQANLKSKIEEIDTKLKDLNLTAAQKSQLLFDHQYADALLEFRKGDEAIYSNLSEINKNVVQGKPASLNNLRSSITSQLTNLKKNLKDNPDSLDERLKNAIETRIETLTKQSNDLEVISNAIANENDIYSRAITVYEQSKPSKPGITSTQFYQELIKTEIYESGKKSTPIDIINSISKANPVSDPDFSSTIKTYEAGFTNNIKQSIENRVKCYDLFTSKGNSAAVTAGCKSF